MHTNDVILFGIVLKNKPEITDKKRSSENLPQRELHIHLPGIKVGPTHEKPSESRVHRKVLLLFPAQTEHTDTHQQDGMQQHIGHFYQQAHLHNGLVYYTTFDHSFFIVL